MTLKQTLDIIQKDKKKNIHPQNRFFIYHYRFGQYFYEKEEIYFLN